MESLVSTLSLIMRRFGLAKFDEPNDIKEWLGLEKEET